MAYVRDLGLIVPRNPVRVANPIYREVIVQVLGARTEGVVTVSPASFLLPDGRLDFGKLLAEFASFWVANGDILTSGAVYHEAAPQLVMMAFLQRIVNGGAADGGAKVPGGRKPLTWAHFAVGDGPADLRAYLAV